MMSTKSMGNKISEARKKMNISQAELSKQLFISPQAVGKWERGESFPDILTFNRLAKILGVDLNYFSEDFLSLVNESVKETNGQRTNVIEGKSKKRLWDFSRDNYANADFSGVTNLQEKFVYANLQNCKLIDADLSGLLLKSNNFEGCDFTVSDFRKSHIVKSNLSNNLFAGSKLNETEFTGSFVYACNFSGANLSDVIFKSCGFEKNILVGVIWKRTTFIDSKIIDVVIEGAVEDCHFEKCTFTRVTFQNARITNTFFKYNNVKRLQFINCEADRITYELLKNAKADVSGIKVISCAADSVGEE